MFSSNTGSAEIKGSTATTRAVRRAMECGKAEETVVFAEIEEDHALVARGDEAVEPALSSGWSRSRAKASTAAGWHRSSHRRACGGGRRDPTGP